MPIDPAKFDQMLNEKAARDARHASIATGDIKPDDMGRALDIGSRRNLPPLVVAQNLPEFDERDRLDEIQEAAKDPVMGRWLQKPEHAALAKDDIASLRRLASTRPNGTMSATPEPSFVEEVVKAAHSGFVRGKNYVNTFLLDPLIPDVRLPEVRREQGDASAAVRFASEERRAQGIERVGSETQAQQDRIAAAEGWVQSLGAIAGSPRAVGVTVAQSLGMFVPGLAATAAGSTLGPGGTAAAAGGSSFALEYGASISTAMQRAGVDQTDPVSVKRFLSNPQQMAAAREYAVRRGVPIALFDAATAGVAGRLIMGTTGSVGSAVARTAGEAGVQSAGGAAGELTAQVVSGDEIAPADILMEAIAEVPTGIVEAAGNYRHAQAIGRVVRSTRDVQTLREFTEAAGEAKTGQRAPAAVEALVGDAGAVYVPAEAIRTLYQTGDAGAFVASLTGDEAALANAGEHGDIAIPAAKWASVVSRLPNAAEWAKHGRTDVDGYSAADLEGLDLDAELGLVEQSEAPESDTSAEVQKDVLAQLMATGTYTPADAELQANVMGKVFGTLASRTGQDAKALYDRYQLRINGPEPGIVGRAIGGARRFLQAAFHGTPHKVDKFSLQKIGSGIGQQAYGWGLYFASRKDVASFFRHELSARKSGMDGDRAGALVSVALKAADGDRQKAIEIVRSRDDGSATDAEVIRRLEAGESGGNLYQVEVPEDTDLLDYEGELAEQQIGTLISPNDAREIVRKWEKATGDKWGDENFYAQTGGQLYATLSDALGGARQASEYLMGLGVPGLRFPDEGTQGNDSRGSSNYVIWDERAITDVRTLNQPADGGGARGQIEIGDGRRMSIRLFRGANRSTFLHESAHFYLEVLQDLDGMEAELAIIREWVGNDGGEFTTEQHEQFARGFEAYLFEGKAPSPELVTAFARFRSWLIGVYKSLRNLNVELTDDVRGVFDRLIATDEEIEAAQQKQGMVPMLTREQGRELGLTDKQWEAYVASLEAGTEEARQEVAAKMLAAIKRQEAVEYREEREKVREEVEAEAELAPAVRAWRILSGAETVNGQPVPAELRGLHLDLETILPDDRAAIRGMGITRKTGGVHPDTAAAVLGYSSGDALVQALGNVRSLKDQVEMEVDRRMAERYPDPITELPEEAMKAIHGNKRVAAMEAELDMLARVSGQPRPNRRQLRAIAEARIARQRIRDIRPNTHLVSERKAARQATEAAAKGDYAAALKAKREQLLSAALYSEAIKATDKAESYGRYLRKAATDKTRERVGKQGGKSYVDALDAILEGHEFRPVSARTVERRTTLREWVEAQQDKGRHTAVSADLLARVEAERVTNVRDLTLGQLSDLRDSVKNLLHLVKVKNEIRTRRGKIEWAEAKQRILDRMRELDMRGVNGISPSDKTILDGLKDLNAAGWNWVLQPETIVEWLDGGTTGPMHDILWEPSEAAEHRREQLQRMVGEKLAEVMKALPAKDRKELDRKRYIASLDKSVSGHTILTALMYAGRDVTYRKLVQGGYVDGDNIAQFTEAQLAEMFATLTRTQAEAAQGMVDALELLWPEIVALEEDFSGIAPEKSQPRAHTVMTADGPVTMRGGYIPIVYDPRGGRAAKFQEDEEAKRVLSGSTPIRPTTSKGHTKHVTDYVAPLLLDYHAILTRHLDGVMGDLSYRVFLGQAIKVLEDAEIKRAIDNRVGPGAVKALRSGFERGAVGNFAFAGPMWGPFQGAADATLTNASAAALGFRIPLALANVVTAPILATARVKKRYLVKGFADYYTNMRGSIETIHQLSPMMLRRAEARTVELRSVLDSLRGERGIRRQMIELSFAVHQWIVPLAENAIWMSAYKQAQAGGADMADSVAAADKAIRQTQTKHTAKDLSVAEGNPYLRWASMFMGPLVIINNRLQESGLRGLRGAVHSPSQAVGTWLAMAAGGAWMFELMMGRGADDEDDDGDVDTKDWIVWSGRKLALLPFAAFPLIRDVATKYDGGWQPQNPLVRAVTSLADAGIGLVDAGYETLFGEPEEVDPERLVKDTVYAAGTATGLPSNQIVKTGSYLVEVSTGQHTPESPKDAWYLLQGPPKD